MRDYYKVLGVSRNISQKDLKKHYYKLAKKLHPDVVEEGNKQDAERKFKTITEAYNALSSTKSRRRYDMGGMSANIVYTNGYSRSATPKKERILIKLRKQNSFSINAFADELRVSYSNLEKILLKFILVYNMNARIENEYIVF